MIVNLREMAACNSAAPSLQPVGEQQWREEIEAQVRATSEQKLRRELEATIRAEISQSTSASVASQSLESSRVVC